MRISDWSSDVCSSDLRRGQCAAAQPGEAVNIGAASQASGVSQRMIRHYEKIGLIPAPLRRDSGYRDYADADVHRLRFIANARDLGFPIEDIRDLLGLWSNKTGKATCREKVVQY